MRVLTFILILAVILLISNASPPKKRAAKPGVGLKRASKAGATRQNSAASRAFSVPITVRKGPKNRQSNEATVNNRRSLQKGISLGSSNNGRVRRAAAARTRVGSKRTGARAANNKKRAQKSSSNRTSGELNDEFFDDDLTLDEASFGNNTESDDLSDTSTKSNATIDELLKNFDLDDDEPNGGEPNVEGGDMDDAKSSELPAENADLNGSPKDENSSVLSDAELDELLKDTVVEPNSKEGTQIDEPLDADKPQVESDSDESRLEPNLENNDEDEGFENPSGELNGDPATVEATGKAADDMDYEDQDDEELPEDHYEESEEDDKK